MNAIFDAVFVRPSTSPVPTGSIKQSIKHTIPAFYIGSLKGMRDPSDWTPLVAALCDAKISYNHFTFFVWPNIDLTTPEIRLFAVPRSNTWAEEWGDSTLESEARLFDESLPSIQTFVAGWLAGVRSAVAKR